MYNMHIMTFEIYKVAHFTKLQIVASCISSKTESKILCIVTFKQRARNLQFSPPALIRALNTTGFYWVFAD